LLKNYNLQIQYHPEKGKRCGRCPDKKGTTDLNTVGITQLNLLRGVQNFGV